MILFLQLQSGEMDLLWQTLREIYVMLMEQALRFLTLQVLAIVTQPFLVKWPLEMVPLLYSLHEIDFTFLSSDAVAS